MSGYYNTVNKNPTAIRNIKPTPGFKKTEEYKKKLEEKKKGKQNLAKGGRAGLKFGSKKSNVQKIQEAFAPKKQLSAKQMKIAKQAGNPKKIEGVDFKKLRGRA